MGRDRGASIDGIETIAEVTGLTIAQLQQLQAENQ